MRERPIIFSGPMVRAILDGRKTQTRRVVTPQTSDILGHGAPRGWWVRMDWSKARAGKSPAGMNCLHIPVPDQDAVWRVYPRIDPGVRLWVRETWRVCSYSVRFHDVKVRYRADDVEVWKPASSIPGLGPKEVDTTWRSPIHIPRWGSRVTLEVTRVRVERVQDISEADAVTEGISEPAPSHGKWCDPTTGREAHWSYRRPFSELWDSINGKRGFGWDVNPWVWVVDFRKLEN